MLDSWFLGTITLIFGLLSSLQGVSTNQTVSTCDVLNCPKGFRCCDNGCCLERKIWNSENKSFRILYIILLFLLPFFIWGLVRHIYHKCRAVEQDSSTAGHQTPPKPHSIPPLESIRVTTSNPPPPYSQHVLEQISIDPRPPYSFRPKGPTGQLLWNGYATL